MSRFKLGSLQTRDLPLSVFASVLAAVLLWLISAGAHAQVPVDVVLFFGVLAVTLYALQWRRVRGLKSQIDVIRSPTVGHATLIGIDVGRSRVSYGALTVDESRGALPRPSEIDVAFGGKSKTLESLNQGPVIYERVIRAIREITTSETPPVKGIAIALPGQVRVDEGVLGHSPGFLDDDEPVVDELAAKLAADRELSCALLRQEYTSEHRRTEELKRMIVIDNDARCATRHQLVEHRHEAGWNSFACLVVGTGVGGGLVLERSLYWGAGLTAGEVGHIALDLDSQLTLSRTGRGNIRYRPDKCHCGGAGVHWESLVAGEGFADLARQLDAQIFREISEVWRSSEPSAALLCDALKHVRGVSNGSLPLGAEKLLERQDIRGYLDDLAHLYAGYFALGIAMLLNALSLDHVSIAGGMMDGIWESVKNDVRATLPQYVLPAAKASFVGFSYSRHARSTWAWQGAALAWRDPSFVSRVPHVAAY